MLSCPHSSHVPQFRPFTFSLEHYYSWNWMEETWIKKGFCSTLAESFGKVMEGNVLWIKSDSNGLADAGVDIVN